MQKYIYCIKIYRLRIQYIGSLQFLCMFLHVCDISSLCTETGKWIFCCTSCASCFCSGVYVQANWPSNEGRCQCCADLDFSGLLWIPFSCLTLLHLPLLVVVTFIGGEHFEVVDFRLMGCRAMQQWVSSNVVFSVASVLTKMLVSRSSQWWWWFG